MKKAKSTEKSLSKKVRTLEEQARQLEEEHTSLQRRAAVLEELLTLRNALVGVLGRVDPGCAIAALEATQQRQQELGPEAEQLLQQLPTHPMAAVVSGIDEALYAPIMHLTPARAVDYWVDRVRDVALLMHLYEREPEANLAALTAAVEECIRWVNALHVFNPAVAYALVDYNMMSCKHQPPPPNHYMAAVSAGKFSPEQLASMQAVMDVVKPRLQQLEQERKQLMEQLSNLPDSYDDSRSMNRYDSNSTVNVAATKTTPTSSSSSSTGSAVACDSCVTPGNSQARRLLQRRQELMQALDRNYCAWRTIFQMRGQWLGSTCSAWQLATGILTAFPYMPFGAPVFDESSKSHKSQQQQDSQQPAQ